MTSHSILPRHPAAWWRVAAATLLAGLALASGAAWADPPGRVGRVAAAEGTVWLYDDAQGEWIEARRNRPVTAGDRVSTERGARVAIQVGSSTVRLDGGTDVEFADLDDERVRLRLHAGSLTLRVRSGEAAREFAVLTEEGRYEPQRAGRYRIDRRDDGSFGAAIGGRLRFEAPDSALEIGEGQRAEFWRERGVTHYAWSALPDDRFADWSAREDREDDREIARERERRYVSPEMTGSDDLDRYGRWDRHPEYGVIWYPTVVATGWAPYRYGHWAYVRPWGWTWVDDAPWGFAPFHYGRWVWWGGRWGWCPGQYVARPVYAPALVAWIGGDNFSIGINVGGGPAVGWVPLAPREVYRPPYTVTNIYIRNINVTHERWQPPPQRAVPTGPIMYTNQGVPGGVTVVSSQVLRERQPISSAVVKPVDPRTIATWQQQQQRRESRPSEAVPPPPPARVTATPGAALPAPPGATRATPWTAPGQARGSRDDGGEAQRVRPPGPRIEAAPERRVETRPERVERSERPEAPRMPQAAPREMPREVQREGPRDAQRDVQREAPAPAQPPRVQRPAPRETPSESPRAQPPAAPAPAQAMPVPPAVQPQRPAGPPASPAARPGAPEAPREGAPQRGGRERDDERGPKDKRRGGQDEREQPNR